MSINRVRTIIFAVQALNPNTAALFLILLGAGLRIWQFSAGASLWIDEIALARSIIERSLPELLNGPLIFGQIAPRGFVLVEKLMVVLFGSNDYVLRALPLLCGLASMVIFWRVAKLVLDPAGALVALALFVTAAPLVIFSVQVKQYSSDVLVALWLFWLSLRSRTSDWSYGHALYIGLAGFVGVFFSHPAVFVLLGLAGGIAVLDGFTRWQGAPSVRPVTIALILWSIAAVGGVLVGIASVTPGGQVFLPNFWVAGFPPISWHEALSEFWPWQPFKLLLRGRGLVTLGYPYPWMCLLFMIGGCLWIYRINKRHLMLLGAPIIVTLTAAILRQYPFSDRLILFLLPTFLLLLAAGIRCGTALLARFSQPLAFFLVLFLTGVGMAPIAAQPPPYRVEEAKPILAYLQSALRPNDAIYVYYGAWQAVQFYGGRYGLAGANYFSGDCSRGSPRRYLEELDQFRGRPRLWIVLLHSVRRYGERDDIVAYLNSIGLQRDYRKVDSYSFRRSPGPAELFLFDLSDPVRLHRTAAKTFPIRGRTTVDPNLPCSVHERPAKAPH